MMTSGIDFLPSFWGKQADQVPARNFAQCLFQPIEVEGERSPQMQAFSSMLVVDDKLADNLQQGFMQLLKHLSAEDEALVIERGVTCIDWSKVSQFMETLIQPVRLRTPVGLQAVLGFLWGKAIVKVKFTLLAKATVQVDVYFRDRICYIEWLQDQANNHIKNSFSQYVRENVSLETKIIVFRWSYYTEEFRLGVDFIGAAEIYVSDLRNLAEVFEFTYDSLVPK